MVNERGQALLKEIQEAFQGVSWEGGTSWIDAQLLDCGTYPTEEELTAQAREKGRNWIDVANDPTWRIELGAAVFSFLDPVGYRFYLPAAMTVAVRGGESECISYSLILKSSTKVRDDITDHKLHQWSLLNGNQRACVKHFLQYMLWRATEPDANDSPDFWQQALEGYWKDVPDAKA